MNVVVAGYQSISLIHGGPLTQLKNTVRYLPDHGVTVRLFDQWSSFGPRECDLVHLFAANIGTYHLAREIKGIGVPLVVTPILFSTHSPAFVRRALGATRLAQRFGPGIWSDYALQADICTWSHLVLPNTQAEAGLVVDGLGIPPGKVRVVPNGVDERFYTADPSLFRKTYGLENFVLNVGHVGFRRKNVLSLIKALATIDHPAVIIGRIAKDAAGAECVREAARFPHIRLLDRMENASEMLASAYAACDVFVLPSLFETPGIAALEAGLAGAKVVITPHGGTTEYFGDMAVYVEPESVDSIRQGILRALAQKKSETLREHLRTHYLWQQVAASTARAYDDVLSHHAA